MRSRWFHPPLLHTAEGKERRVSWLELFYDLIFVAAIIQLGDALSHDVSLKNFGAFAGHFVPLWLAWTSFTFYVNRFDVDDFLHRILVFGKMFGVGAMALAAPQAMHGDPHFFALAYAAVQGMVAVLYFRAWRQVPEARSYCYFWGGIFVVGSIVWLISSLVPTPWCYLLWGLGIAITLYAVLCERSRNLDEQFPVDVEHLAERYGLLTIIVLGESFVKVLSMLNQGGHGADPEFLAKGCLNLLITCCVWWIYFDDVAGSTIKKGRKNWIVWLCAHIPLTIAVTAVGVALKKSVQFDLSAAAPDAYRWLLCGALALALISVAVIDGVTNRRHSDLGNLPRVLVRLGSALLALMLGQIGGSMSAAVFMLIVCAICVGQVLFDMMMAPLEEAAVAGDAPISLAEVARLKARQVKEGRGGRQYGAHESVRQGIPSELRSDLYFFFMEGSWVRLLGSFIFIYLIVNVFFAGLYVLDPSSISGTGESSFADAFYFSVQTMTTIGFGGLQPHTDYGNLLVTAEAACGLMGVALATGLIFAKVSRPQQTVMFTKNVLVTNRDGKKALILRAGNTRGNDLVDAHMTLTVMTDEVTAEGHHMRRAHTLKLLTPHYPIFLHAWTLVHVIDDESPLKNVDWSKPEDHIVMFVATLLAHDGTYGQTTYSRHYYYAEDVRPGQHFADIMSRMPDGRTLINYEKFNETIADEIEGG